MKHLTAWGMAALACLSTLAYAGSPNTTAANAVPYEVGQGWVSHYFDETTTTRWFRFGEVAGRSYCIEAVQGSVSPIALDPNVTAYTDINGTTTLNVTYGGGMQSNDNGVGDPIRIKGSRTCYISPLLAPSNVFQTATRSVKLNVPITGGSGDAGFVRFRVVETTLVAMGAGVASLSYANLGTSGIGISVWAPPHYMYQLGSGSAIPAQGSYQGFMMQFVNGQNEVNYSGGPVFVAHSGPPGTVIGTVDFGKFVTDPNTQQQFFEVTSTVPLKPRSL